jgi:hypothetical protein
MRSKYQTLNQFVLSPFYDNSSMEKDIKYTTRYNQYKISKSIYVKAVTEIESSWYYHIKVPSELNSGKLEYDVIIRFFTDKPFIESENHLRNYYIQFFSNSPGFIYKYAYVYNKRGYLIDLLVSKLNPEAINTPPDKTNTDQKLSYDSTIYYACRYLSELQLNKMGIFNLKKVTPDKFFREISDFNSIRIENDIINEEKKLEKELLRSKNKNGKTKDDDSAVGKSHPKNKVIGTSRRNKMGKILPKAKNAKISARKSTFKK